MLTKFNGPLQSSIHQWDYFWCVFWIFQIFIHFAAWKYYIITRFVYTRRFIRSIWNHQKGTVSPSTEIAKCHTTRILKASILQQYYQAFIFPLISNQQRSFSDLIYLTGVSNFLNCGVDHSYSFTIPHSTGRPKFFCISMNNNHH